MGNRITKINRIMPIYLEKGQDEIKNDKCCICLKNFTNNSIMLSCGHHFHSECLLKWFDKRKTCPMCRENYVYVIINKNID